MAGQNLAPLLILVRDAGLEVRVDEGDLVVWPSRALAPGLQAELLRHKPELLKLLVWGESEAHALVKDAFAYLAEFHLKIGSPEFRPAALDAPEDAIDKAFSERDMFALRIAVRELVEAGLRAFEDAQRGAAS